MVEVVRADWSDPAHAAAVVLLLNEYATDIMGGGEALSDHTRSHLVEELKNRDTSRVVLAFVDAEPAGLGICFEGFSTFQCAPILNIHDLTVAPSYRGRGISKLLLAEIEAIARETGCAKLTLEVLEGNTVARGLYQQVGFAPYELDPNMGQALFYEKKVERTK